MGEMLANHVLFGAQMAILAFAATGVFAVQEAGGIDLYFFTTVTDTKP